MSEAQAGTQAGAQAAEGSEPLLQVEDLSVSFYLPGASLFAPQQELRAVSAVSLEIRPGETLGVVGESGCGKSTLGRAILQLIAPSSGRVLWLGEEITGLGPAAMRPKRRDLQIIFQDPLASLNPRMTVGDIIAEPLRTHRPELPKAARREEVRAMLERVGLAPANDQPLPARVLGRTVPAHRDCARDDFAPQIDYLR